MQMKAIEAIIPKSAAHPAAPPIAAVLFTMVLLLLLLGGVDVVVPDMSKRIRIKMKCKYILRICISMIIRYCCKYIRTRISCK